MSAVVQQHTPDAHQEHFELGDLSSPVSREPDSVAPSGTRTPAADSDAGLLSRSISQQGSLGDELEPRQEFTEEGGPESAASALPPIDGGREAWIFICGAALTELICYGPALSYSIFQEYLTSEASSSNGVLPGATSVSVSAIGTLLVCLIYLTGPLFQPLWSRYPAYNQRMSFGMACLTSISLMIASFTTHSIGALMVFMGVLPGLGSGASTLAYMIAMPQWFLRRRSLANGLSFAGAGAGGVFFPFLFSALLSRVGFAWTLRVWALINLAGLSVGIYWTKRRLPIPSRANRSTELGSSDLGDRRRRRPATLSKVMQGYAYLSSSLWLLNAALTFTASVSFFSVSFFLATYCSSLGLSSAAGTGVVASFNAAGLIGEIAIGYACDRFSYTRVMLLLAIVGSLSTFLLFGLAQSLGGVLAFVFLYGFAAGAWCSTWTRSATDIARLRSMQTATVVLSFCFVRGIASLVGPLIAAALYRPEENVKKAIFGAFGFDRLIEFVGACMVITAVTTGALEFTRRVSFSKADDADLQERFH